MKIEQVDTSGNIVCHKLMDKNTDVSTISQRSVPKLGYPGSERDGSTHRYESTQPKAGRLRQESLCF